MKIKKLKNKKYILKDYESLDSFIETKEYIKAMKNENFNYILELIINCDFDIEINTDGTINLWDLQGAYLGGVESYENFANIFEACERLEGCFLYDYFKIDACGIY